MIRESIAGILVSYVHGTRDQEEAVDAILSLFPRARKGDPTTSHIAASAPQSGNRRLVLDLVREYGALGTTVDDVTSRHGFARGLHRRFCELERAGWIVKNGTRIGNAGVPQGVYYPVERTIGSAL